MANALSVLRESLPGYITDVKNKHSENSKAFAFSSFIQNVFGIKSEELDLEVPIKTTALKLRGRIDAVFGNLIIEFKKDLRNSIDTAEEELTKYFQGYHDKRPNARFLGIANDGILFKVYHPVFQNEIVTGVDLIDEIDIEKKRAEDVFLWFDSYLFTSDKIIPNSKDLKKRFGLESPTFAAFTRQLDALYAKVQDSDNVRTKYENWSRFLEIVYGDRIDELDLFFKHTYLSAFAKLMVYLKISGGKLIRKEQVSQIFFGDVFSQARILNFIEEDFFTWCFYPTLRKESTEIMFKLLQQLVVYDLNMIDEDILKELYQELVDPDQRKLLGEFYTPDWLAELTVQRVLEENPMSSIMDPACGSGTFLFKAISYKITTLSNKGLTKSEILKHVLENVLGFDVHPLAVTIAKTNYLLSLKDLLDARTGSITVPVYLSDSLKTPQISNPQIDKPLTLFEFQVMNNKKFVFPVGLAANLTIIDDIIEKMRMHAREYESIVSKIKHTEQRFSGQHKVAKDNLVESFKRSIANIVIESEKEVIVENLKLIFEFIDSNTNSIWTYILRNMFKPIAVT